MSISEKMKAISGKIEQNKAQYDLDTQTAKITALSSRNVSKYESLTGKDVFAGKDLVEKAAALKRFEYSPLEKSFAKQANAIKKQAEVINKKEDKRSKLLKRIIGIDGKYRDKVRNAFFSLFTQRTGREIC